MFRQKRPGLIISFKLFSAGLATTTVAASCPRAAEVVGRRHGDLATAQQIEACPSEQPSDGIEIRAKCLAANAGGLKRDGTAAAEAVAHAGCVAEGSLA